jgi:hypothetical protein
MLVGVIDERDGRRAVKKVIGILVKGETGESRHTRNRFRTRKEDTAEDKVSR